MRLDEHLPGNFVAHRICVMERRVAKHKVEWGVPVIAEDICMDKMRVLTKRSRVHRNVLFRRLHRKSGFVYEKDICFWNRPEGKNTERPGATTEVHNVVNVWLMMQPRGDLVGQ